MPILQVGKLRIQVVKWSQSNQVGPLSLCMLNHWTSSFKVWLTHLVKGGNNVRISYFEVQRNIVVHHIMMFWPMTGSI